MFLLDEVRTIGKGLRRLPRKMFGTRNDRLLKKLKPLADEVQVYEPKVRALCSQGSDYDEAFEARVAELPAPPDSDPDAQAAYESQLQAIRVELSKPLRERGDELRSALAANADPDEVLAEAFAILREASRRAQAHRHFPCQLIGGKVLYDGAVAEMRTGEGKTIVCHLAAYMKFLQGLKVHIVTVNDYLVKRDAEFAAPIFELLGVTVGYIQSQIDPSGREGIRQRAYACDVTYGTASEFGFDYLRDNMKTRLADQVQGSLDFAIIDEVDSILIDEARTPLIISGGSGDDVSRYSRADRVAAELVRRQDQWDRRVRKTVTRFDGETHNIEKLSDAMNILGYGGRKVQRAHLDETEGAEEVEELAALGPDFLTDDHAEAIQTYEAAVLGLPAAERYRRYFVTEVDRKSAHLTHDGVTIAQELLEVGSLYSGDNMEWPHLIENALRAHKVYLRDKDYVVQNGGVIIVDQFTGRLMHGRQWSDGLHQAVEAKENVKVKEETQTLATITIQNFFKLYKSIAGMTGTAATEATEFMKIYKLEVLEIPTNRPVNRQDYNDKIYRSVDEKYKALVQEIHEVQRRGRPNDPYIMADVFRALRPIKVRLGQPTDRLDAAMDRFNNADGPSQELLSLLLEVYDEEMADFVWGRPILVGTTSVEDSERLSRMLTRTFGIEHEVLNAKHHEREAEIVAKAGQQSPPLRGSKTPVGNVTIATNMAGRGTDIKLALPVVYQKCRVPDPLPEGAHETGLYPAGMTKCCMKCEEYDAATNCAHCFKPKLDPRFPALGRFVCAVNVPCGLHITGTERHESRRIDNQLRGRSGRQGDPGSSRFFLSLEDDLLKLFMSDFMLKMLERFGFADGTSLEDRRLTKGIEKAQTKVEERNFMIRKSLLEWDEPKDYQRKEFYAHRQRILEGRDIPGMVTVAIRRTIEATVGEMLSPEYPRKCAADWARLKLDLQIDLESFDLEDIEGALASIRASAKDEARDQIRTSVGEYIDPEEPPSKWDVSGLVRWATKTFKLSVTQNQIRKMDPRDIEDLLFEAAERYYDELPLDGMERFADPIYTLSRFIDWARGKFGVELTPDDLKDKSSDEVIQCVESRVLDHYRQREVSYPVEICLEQAFMAGEPGSAQASEIIASWVNEKYDLGWSIQDGEGKSAEVLYGTLLKLNEDYYLHGKLADEIRSAIEGKDREDVLEWARKRFRLAFNEKRFNESELDLVEALEVEGKECLRYELTRLEQFVLLRIHDQAWKDHLLELDHLEHAIRQRPLAGDQTHPQSQFAIEGRELFNEVWGRIDDRVTDMVFKVRAVPTGPPATPTSGTSDGGPGMRFNHADASGAGFATAANDTAAAMRAQNVEHKVETIRREAPRVGRNDPCPCGSGKKFKQCHGRV